MQVVLEIPDEFLARVVAAGGDAGAAALESLGLEAYRSGRLGESELQAFLGMESRFEVEALLKQRGVVEGAYGVPDWRDDEKPAERLAESVVERGNERAE